MTNNIIQTYFFDLIKVAIGNKKSLSGNPTPNEWKEIYILAKKQTLIGILFGALDKLPIEQRPPKTLLMQWFAATEAIQENNSQVNADAVKMCKIIREYGLRCVVLKGQGIATYYPEPSLRQCGDIDLWIEGGAKKVIEYIRSNGKIKSVTYIHIDYKAPVSTEVEVHYRPTFLYNPIYHKRLSQYFNEQNELFENSVELPDGSGKIYVPTLEFNRYYVLQHIYRHYFGEGIGLRQLLDYYYVLLKGGTEESKQRTINLFKRTGMFKFVGATMWVLQQVFGMDDQYLLCTPHEKAGKQLLDEILLSGNFGKYDTRIDRKNHHKLLPRVYNYIKRNIRFVTGYPKEILFEIPMRTYMYVWKHFI